MREYDKVRLGDIFQVVTGSTPSTSELRYYGGNIPFVTPAELDQADPIKVAKVQLTEEGANVSRLLPADTILVCCIGSLGKVGISGRPLVTNQQINALISNEKLVHPRYALHACRQLKPILEAIAPSTTVKIVNKSRFSDLQIPLPRLEEQRRIAAILDQAEALLAKRRQALAKLDTLTRSLFLEMFDVYLSSEGRDYVPLSSVALIASGITKGRIIGNQPTKSVPYLRVANVQDGYLNLSELKEINATNEEIIRWKLQIGDVLMTEGGDFDKLGRGAVWHSEVSECIHQNHIFRVRLNRTRLLPEVFRFFLQTAFALRYFLKCAKKTSNLASINMTQLKALPVLAPPLQLQERFCAVLSALAEVHDRHESSRKSTSELLISLQHRAFRGEL